MELAMAQALIRGLSAGDEVLVDLDGQPGRDPDFFAARVESVYGATARLAPVDELTAELRARLKPGALGHLNAERESAPVSMRGIALLSRHGRELEFAVVEGIRLKDRRTV